MKNIELKTVLKNGDIVRINKVGNENWNTNIAFDVRDDVLTLDAGMNENYYDFIKVGDEIRCKVTTDKFEYNMSAVVSSMSDNPIRTMSLKVNEIKKYVNTRKDLRHFVHLFALIREDEYDKDPIFSVVTDISKGGVAALINDKNSMKKGNIKVDDKLYFEISLEDQRKIKFEGIVRREKKTKASLEYGVQINTIDSDNKRILDEYVDELKNMDDEFQQLKQEIWEYNFSV